MGTLDPAHGLDDLFGAVELVPDNYRFQLIGRVKDADQPWLDEWLQHPLVSTRVEIKPQVSYQNIVQEIDRCDVLLAPAGDTIHSLRYRSPLKVFDYMMRGKPIIAADVPSHREILQTGQSTVFTSRGKRNLWLRRFKPSSGSRKSRRRLLSALGIAPRVTLTMDVLAGCLNSSERIMLTPERRAILHYISKMFTLEPHYSPIFFHGIWCLLWRLADYLPGRFGYGVRWAIGRKRLGNLGAYPRFRPRNIFFDGRNVQIGDGFTAGIFNYFSGVGLPLAITCISPILRSSTTDIALITHTPDCLAGIIREPIVINDDVWIGDRVTILGGVIVGRGRAR